MDELIVVRRRGTGIGKPIRIRSAADVYLAFKPVVDLADREYFYVLLLNAKNDVLGFNIASIGSLTGSLVHPREVFKPAILMNAAALILVHNHPSGDIVPSQEDMTITTRLKNAGEILGIHLIDHIIIGDDTYLSFADDGYWPSSQPIP